MSLSWIEQAKKYNSPLSVVAGFLLRSRQTQAERAKRRTQEIQQLRKSLEQQRQTIREQHEQLAEKDSQIARLENQWLRKQSPTLPVDPRLPHHEFGPKMISLCVNLSREIGLRPTCSALKIFFDWLGASPEKLPERTTIRNWLMRVGVAAMEQPIEPADDWILLADHSNQVGVEKVLAVLGVRASQLPPPGVSLSHEDMRVLMLQPGVSWKREDMANAYQTLAERMGNPLALLIDGAVELREGAEILQKSGEKDVIILGDFKHFAANVLKRVVGGDERYSTFSSQLGFTRSGIQQTKLAHLTPPSPKPKSRFMNLERTLSWAQMVLWHLGHPYSESRKGIDVAYVNEKLGWLRKFRNDIQRWSQCQAIVSTSLTFINEQGLFQGAADMLHACIEPLMTCHASTHVGNQLLDYVRQSEAKLDPTQRLPLSTEILESSFGLFKQLERQHSKGGFTSLLAAFGALLRPSTPATIRRDFELVSTKRMRQWVSDNLRTTLTSKRQTAYAEFVNAA